MTGIVAALTTYQQRANHEQIGRLIDHLTGRCDRAGLDLVIARHADSAGPVYAISADNWRAPHRRISVHATTLPDALDQILDELNRQEGAPE